MPITCQSSTSCRNIELDVPAAKSQWLPYLFDFLPALVGLRVGRSAAVSSQRGFEQAPSELLVTKSIRVGTVVRGCHFLRRGLCLRPGEVQILLRFAPGEPDLGRLVRDWGFAALTFQLDASLSFSRGHALVFGSF